MQLEGLTREYKVYEKYTMKRIKWRHAKMYLP